jgi:enoyl-CoA hydratase/carnithine racemase
MLSGCVRLECEDDVAVVVIDNPRINAGALEVRSGLFAAIEEAGKHPEVSAIVLMRAGNTFIAGSDLREFGQPLAEPQLPAVIAASAGIALAALDVGFDVVLLEREDAALSRGVDRVRGCRAGCRRDHRTRLILAPKGKQPVSVNKSEQSFRQRCRRMNHALNL